MNSRPSKIHYYSPNAVTALFLFYPHTMALAMCIPETGHTTARGRRFPNSPVSSTTFTSYTSAAPHHRGKNHISNIAQKTLPGEWLTRSGSLHLQHASFPVKQKTICSHWLGRRDLTGWRPVGLSGQYGDWIRRRVLKGLGNNRLPPHLAQKMRPFPASSRVCKFLLFCSGYKS